MVVNLSTADCEDLVEALAKSVEAREQLRFAERRAWQPGITDADAEYRDCLVYMKFTLERILERLEP